MITITAMPKPRAMLELRLREPATAARVERAAKMFGAVLAAVGHGDDTSITLIVENDHLKATVRTRNTAGAAAVSSVIRLVKHPLSADQPHPGRSELATALARYARDEARFTPQFWLPGKKKALCVLDDAFAAVMDALASAPEPGANTVNGTTYVYSKILRVGRSDEGKQYRVRIALDGRPLDVPLEDELPPGPLFDAAKRDVVVRLRLRARWLHRPGEPPWLCKAVVIGVDENAAPASGSRILALARQFNVITAEELPAVLSSIDRSADGNG